MLPVTNGLDDSQTTADMACINALGKQMTRELGCWTAERDPHRHVCQMVDKITDGPARCLEELVELKWTKRTVSGDSKADHPLI